MNKIVERIERELGNPGFAAKLADVLKSSDQSMAVSRLGLERLCVVFQAPVEKS